MEIGMSIDPELLTNILLPFAAGPTAGEDLRLDTTPQSLYFRLRDARSEARAEERAADSDPAAGGVNPVHWKTVRDLAAEALRDRTKDIEIAVWLAESLTRSHGLPGLTGAAMILAGLIERFWDDGLFPSSDEADPEGRLIAISGLSGLERDGSLMQPLQKTVLFHLSGGTPLTFWEYERSREVAGAGTPSGEESKPATTLPEFAMVEAAANGPGQADLQELGRQAAAASGAWAHLETVLAGVAQGDAAPSTSRVAGVLDRLRRTVERYVAAGLSEAAGAKGDGPVPALAGALDEAAHGPDAQPGAEVTRESLLGQVAGIARSFRRLEPNSPISYTLEEAIRRANMSWPDLIRELVPELPQRANIMSGAGLKPPAD